MLFAVGVSRFASLLSGLAAGLLGDAEAQATVAQDLRTGQHRNPMARPVGVEGPGWTLPDVAARWADAAAREQLLMAARAVEGEPSLLGLSAHIMVVARQPPARLR